MATEQTFVIVGAGLTAAMATQMLREEYFSGRMRRPARVQQPVAGHWRVDASAGCALRGPRRGVLPAPDRGLRAASYDRVPYFFTDQYDLAMEFTGWFPHGGFDALVIRGDLDARAFYAFWLTGDRIVAGMHVNRWYEGIAPVQELIRLGTPVDRDLLADPGVPLADLLPDMEPYRGPEVMRDAVRHGCQASKQRCH